MDGGTPVAAGAERLRDELASNPGRLGLLVDGDAAQIAAERLAEAWGVRPIETGMVLTSDPEPPGPGEVIRRLSTGSIYVGLDILFSRDLRVNLMSLLRQMARTAPRVFLWPGQIAGTVATYSRPERPDHFEERLSDALGLRAQKPRFPDEAPYMIERIP